MANRKKSKSRSRPLPIVPVRSPRAPFVSVIIPVYNCADFLGQAIDSVLSQTFMDLEIIVVDDGSTDRTPEVSAQYSDQITYIRQPNGGNAAARNRGVVEARGRWLCFLDADDLWEPKKLERQLLDLLRHPEWMISFVRARKFFESGDSEPIPADPAESEMWDKLVFYQPFGSSHSGMMLHASCFEQVGGFDDALRLSVDWDLFIRLADRYRIRVLPEFLVHHRQHSSNTTGDAELRLRMYLACLNKHRRLFCSKRGMLQAPSAETSSGVVRGVRTLRAVKPSRPACGQPSADCRSISASWRMLSISTLSRGAGSPLHDTTLTTPGRSSTVDRFVPRSR